MEEIFPNIPIERREQIAFFFDRAFENKNHIEIANALNKFTNNCYTPEERAFARFYFNLRMEQLSEKDRFSLGEIGKR